LAAGRVEMYIAIVTLDSLGWLVMRHPKQMIKMLFLHFCNQIGINIWFCFVWGMGFPDFARQPNYVNPSFR
jgi:hypothetical protein